MHADGNDRVGVHLRLNALKSNMVEISGIIEAGKNTFF